MVRLRAVEHGREALMVSTVGISAFVDTRGAVSDATRFDTGAVKVREVHTGATRTLASRIGAAPEYAAVVAALVVLLLAARLRGRARRVRAATRVAGPPSAARPGGPPSEGEV
jgi:apolipoprotein N-acyltransferase